MLEKIHHIGLVTDDVERTKKLFLEKLGCEPNRIQEVDSKRAKVAFLRMGDIEIEIMQPKDPSNQNFKILERNGGPCLSHIAFSVPETASVGTELSGKGVKFLSGFGPGTYSGRGYGTMFLEPDEVDGILIQVVSDKPEKEMNPPA